MDGIEQREEPAMNRIIGKIKFCILGILPVTLSLSAILLLPLTAEAITVTETIKKDIGLRPIRIVISPDNAEVYILNAGSDTVSVINTNRNKVIKQINVGKHPNSLVITRDGKKLYVGYGEDRVGGGINIIDTKEKRVVNTMPTKGNVRDLAITPDETKLYVAMLNEGLWKINTRDNSLIQLNKVSCPTGVVFSPDGTKAYISYQCAPDPGAYGHDPIFIYDTRNDDKGNIQPLRTILHLSDDDEERIANVGGSLAISPNGKQVWVHGVNVCSSSQYIDKDSHNTEGCPNLNPGEKREGRGIINIINTETYKVTVLPFYGLSPENEKTLIGAGTLTFFPDGTKVAVSTGIGIRIFNSQSLKEMDSVSETGLEVNKEMDPVSELAWAGNIVFTNRGTAYVPVPDENAVKVLQIQDINGNPNLVPILTVLWRLGVIHFLIWVALFMAYPRFPLIQAIVFWNKWVRRIAGLFYIDLALTWIPFCRRRLFLPFKESLLSDASLQEFEGQAYFEESEVEIKIQSGGIERRPIQDAIPEIRGQIVLEGDSGLGKTMYLRYLVKHSKRITAFLKAEKCSGGVIEALAVKLLGPAKDHEYLQTLIYSGAIDICIDGINEVTADTWAKISAFVTNYSRGNIIIATQPIEWTPPSTAKRFVIQPLRREKIEDFLLKMKQNLPEGAFGSDTHYDKVISNYLSETLNEKQPEEELATAARILSNPMDLSVVAQILANNQKPNLLRLLEQQYNIMADDYKHVNANQSFPLRNFSESVYQMKVNDDSALDEKNFVRELECMGKHKMVISRLTLDSHSQPRRIWYFRHDKIMEFFIVQTFLGQDNDRPVLHFSDPKFRGVYFLLAMMLPLDDALNLREQLINYAANTKDHTVSDTFIQIVRSRTNHKLNGN